MSLINKVNYSPSRKDLCSFGKIALIASAFISLLLYLLKGLAIQWALIILTAGFLIFLSSVISSKLTKAIYLTLILLTLPIGMLISFVLLLAFYYLLLTPVGLFFRLIGRDPLHRKFDSNAESYWVVRHPPDSLDRYFHQF